MYVRCTGSYTHARGVLCVILAAHRSRFSTEMNLVVSVGALIVRPRYSLVDIEAPDYWKVPNPKPQAGVEPEPSASA